MMRTIALAAAFAIAPIPLAAQEAEGDPVIEFDSVDARMNAAIAEARATSPRFLEVLEAPPLGTENIVFKFPLEGREHIWVGSVGRDGSYLTGRLKNNPHSQGWQLGDEVRVPIGEISDWGYVDPVGKAHGFFTVRIMVEEMSPEDAAAVRRQYGWEE